MASTLNATLPQAMVDTSLPVGWDGPADATPANGAELVQALAEAVQNSGTYVIELAAGTTYTGNFFVENKAGSRWLIIRTAGWESSHVAEGVRVTPADASSMATLLSPDNHPIFRAGLGAHHIRFIGVEFAVDERLVPLVAIGYDDNIHDPKVDSDFAHHIGFDRVYIHSTSRENLSRVGIIASANDFFVINSRIDNIKDSADAQAILVYSSRGPVHIENNYLEATGENIMFGGADTSIDKLVPSDITILRNHLTKRLEWNKHDASFNGIDWGIKNLFELKNARRVLLQSNILENNWSDAQNGTAILLTPRNQDGGNPWAEVKDVTIENNDIRNIGKLALILGEDDIKQSETCERITIQNNMVHSVGGSVSGAAGEFVETVTAGRPVKDLTVNRNTFVFSEGHLGGSSFRINICSLEGLEIIENIFGDGMFSNAHRLSTIPNRTISGNGVFFHPDANAYEVRLGRFDDDFGPGNFKADTIDDVGFEDRANLDYALTNDSPFKGILDGKDPGVDFEVLHEAIEGVFRGRRSVSKAVWIEGVVTGVSKADPVPDPPFPEYESERSFIAEIASSIDALESINTSELTRNQGRDLDFAILYLKQIIR